MIKNKYKQFGRGTFFIIEAAKNNNFDLVKTLIESECFVNLADDNGSTALHEAVYNNHFEIVKLLIDNGANVNCATTSGLTPLHFASRNGNIEIVKLLLDRGANYNAKSANGFIPVDYAKNIEIQKILNRLTHGVALIDYYDDSRDVIVGNVIEQERNKINKKSHHATPQPIASVQKVEQSLCVNRDEPVSTPADYVDFLIRTAYILPYYANRLHHCQN
jgi:ankyrin repeat protein